MRRIAFVKCKSLKQTRATVKTLIGTNSDDFDKFGDPIPETECTFAVLLFRGDDSKVRAARKGLKEGITTFTQVCAHLQILHNDIENEKATAAYADKSSSNIDLSALA